MISHTPVRVSYLITTRNRAQFLQKTLENVREFITPEDELIIFDAASTDETQEVAERNKDIITLFVSEADKGEAHGLNKGILASKGKYIKFLTDDDYFYPDAMRRTIQILNENPDIDVLLSRGTTWYVDKAGEKRNPISRSLPEPYDLKSDLIDNWGIKLSGQSLLLRKGAISELGLLDCQKKLVDLDYYVKLIQSKLKCKYCDEKLYDHMIWSGSGCHNLQENDVYWIELSEALLRLRDWKSLLKLQSKWILSALQLPHDFPCKTCLFEVIRRGTQFPKSKKLLIIEKISKMLLTLFPKL